MTRNDFITLLGELIGAGQITLEEARQALRLFDRGDLEVPTHAISLDDVISTTDTPKNAPDGVQDRYDQQVAHLATKADDPQAWHSLFALAVAGMLVSQWLAGGGRQRTSLQGAWDEQQSYLQTFGATVAIRRAVGRPMTPEGIASRSVLYGGAGRGLYYLETENGLDPFSFVVDYVSVDDPHTCDICLTADRNSPYLVGVGYRPGQGCRGRGRCRCKRIARYDPATAKRLRGTQEPTIPT